MPRRDGTGPMSQGAVTGRGLGRCTGVNANGATPFAGRGMGRMARGIGMGIGFGLGCGRGLGRFLLGSRQVGNERAILEEEKQILKSRMDAIDQMLNESTDDNA
ncbi:DUF5320 domain-containing protein [Alkalibacter rhizosphaerae]|uniref:DUF5320 domain-containing protein n=1 Tax=Alkalibacter rhizosphaerae TaxID=2815577 RepID=A0A975AII6_9FIRM|nr:DUF5320 domain-containing protein [Alkalibacter rhizosphaerae]QSX08560.1 DUF5320 domain-containing protein [Alkalibacter rhizosphaerae]